MSRRVGYLWISLPLVAGFLALGQEGPVEPAGLPASRGLLSEHFATSQECALCHSSAPQAKGLRDAKGRSVAPFDLWQSTMMANSARDPLWRAAVSVEVAATPGAREKIEAKCLRCHAPMASAQAAFSKERGLAIGDLFRDDERGQLGVDGVSCTLCHQIEAHELGTPESYSGHYDIHGEKTIFGPYADPVGMPMIRHTGFRPEQGMHVRRSALCATCHTLFTDAVDAEAKPTGQRLPEQTPYLEWRNSAFSDEGEEPGPLAASCQECHMPRLDLDGEPIQTRIARNPMGGDFRIQERAPFGRHVFVGGNVLVPAILRDNAERLRPQASKAAFDATLALAREQLEERTARVWVGAVERSGPGLSVSVRVENLAGHKLPTGHPTRRAWLRVRVFDAAGEVLWASGEHDGAGVIVGGDGAALPGERKGGPVYPHRTEVTGAEQVQVYEAVMADAEGAPTYLLMRGGSYLKDSRLLPRGWRADGPDAEHTRPQGLGGDADFRAATDDVVYRVALPEGARPAKVEASLLYQTLGARYAAELLSYDTPQVKEFAGYYAKADRTPVTLSTAERALGE